eukprot:TRINITY_DN1126_c2_g3_i1.p1 TRINITY_DN1126_c2_g3~~TRINITY_DN1126_c2_g3_i1.p1  ORF type:complete len:584 (+),score=285.29 TRINITY_DN1126_c2_g3_i1:89-1753(+)
MAAEQKGQPQTSSLYVGDLAPETTEANLFDTFREVGPVLSIRVCRDAVTRKSLGYAYVNFQNHVDAARALQDLNFAPIRNKPCRIMWCRRDPAQRKNAKGNIYVKNLHTSIDAKALHDTFASFGTILSCKVATDEQGRSRGYGFVHFASEEAADEAVGKVNGMLLSQQMVYVGKFERKEKKIAKLESTYTNCYVKHFQKGLKDDEIKAYFGKFGEISSLLVRRGEDGKALGFAFVNFKDHGAADKCVAEANGSKDSAFVQEGKALFVSRHQRKDEREHLRRQKARERAQQYVNYTNLYIKNLHDSVTTPMLRESFAEFGNIISARVMTNPDTSTSKGFGFVCFRDAEAANKAVQAMSGRIFCEKPLYVTIAQRKEQRRAQLELFYRSGRSPFTGGPQGPPMGMQPVFGGASRGGGGFGFGSRGGGGRGGPRTGTSRGGMRQMPMMPMGMAYPQMQRPVMPSMMPVRPMPQQQQRNPAGVDASQLAGMSAEQQKNALGEKLYAKIGETDPANAAKVTGMLLEMDNSEILNLLDSPDLLASKVKEANQVLRDHAGR